MSVAQDLFIVSLYKFASPLHNHRCVLQVFICLCQTRPSLLYVHLFELDIFFI